jgi:hypothetical protein
MTGSNYNILCVRPVTAEMKKSSEFIIETKFANNDIIYTSYCENEPFFKGVLINSNENYLKNTSSKTMQSPVLILGFLINILYLSFNLANHIIRN